MSSLNQLFSDYKKKKFIRKLPFIRYVEFLQSERLIGQFDRKKLEEAGLPFKLFAALLTSSIGETRFTIGTKKLPIRTIYRDIVKSDKKLSEILETARKTQKRGSPQYRLDVSEIHNYKDNALFNALREKIISVGSIIVELMNSNNPSLILRENDLHEDEVITPVSGGNTKPNKSKQPKEEPKEKIKNIKKISIKPKEETIFDSMVGGLKSVISKLFRPVTGALGKIILGDERTRLSKEKQEKIRKFKLEISDETLKRINKLLPKHALVSVMVKHGIGGDDLKDTDRGIGVSVDLDKLKSLGIEQKTLMNQLNEEIQNISMILSELTLDVVNFREKELSLMIDKIFNLLLDELEENGLDDRDFVTQKIANKSLRIFHKDALLNYEKILKRIKEPPVGFKEKETRIMKKIDRLNKEVIANRDKYGGNEKYERLANMTGEINKELIKKINDVRIGLEVSNMIEDNKGTQITMPHMNWCGPQNLVESQLKNIDIFKPVNEIDEICMQHDIDYAEAVRNEQIREADIKMVVALDELIPKLKLDSVEMGDAIISRTGIATKMQLENAAYFAGGVVDIVVSSKLSEILSPSSILLTNPILNAGNLLVLRQITKAIGAGDYITNTFNYGSIRELKDNDIEKLEELIEESDDLYEELLPVWEELKDSKNVNKTFEDIEEVGELFERVENISKTEDIDKGNFTEFQNFTKTGNFSSKSKEEEEELEVFDDGDEEDEPSRPEPSRPSDPPPVPAQPEPSRPSEPPPANTTDAPAPSPAPDQSPPPTEQVEDEETVNKFDKNIRSTIRRLEKKGFTEEQMVERVIGDINSLSKSVTGKKLHRTRIFLRELRALSLLLSKKDRDNQEYNNLKELTKLLILSSNDFNVLDKMMPSLLEEARKLTPEGPEGPPFRVGGEPEPPLTGVKPDQRPRRRVRLLKPDDLKNLEDLSLFNELKKVISSTRLDIQDGDTRNVKIDFKNVDSIMREFLDRDGNDVNINFLDHLLATIEGAYDDSDFNTMTTQFSVLVEQLAVVERQLQEDLEPELDPEEIKEEVIEHPSSDTIHELLGNALSDLETLRNSIQQTQQRRKSILKQNRQFRPELRTLQLESKPLNHEYFMEGYNKKRRTPPNKIDNQLWVNMENNHNRQFTNNRDNRKVNNGYSEEYNKRFHRDLYSKTEQTRANNELKGRKYPEKKEQMISLDRIPFANAFGNNNFPPVFIPDQSVKKKFKSHFYNHNLYPD